MRILVSGATATMRNLVERHRQHLGVLLTPQNGNRICSLPLPWACDNAAYSNPDDDKFWRLCMGSWDVTEYHPPLWVAVPDVVGNHSETLRLFGIWCDYWRAELGCIPWRLAFVLQDGCRPGDVPWDEIKTVFVGGTTGFKLRKTGDLIAEAKQRGKLVHIGRVNTLRRIKFAHDVGADTVDGTAFSMFPATYIGRACRYLESLEQSPTLF